MPMRALSLCSHPGCSVLLVRPGKCGLHAAKPWAQTLSRQERGYDVEHDRLRKVVLAEEPWCYICRANPSTTADHVIPLSQGGTTTRENMRGACKDCQRSKAGREGAQARTPIDR